MKYIVLRNFVHYSLCRRLINSYFDTEKEEKSLNLFGDSDKINVEYNSTRSPNLSYQYLDTNPSWDLSQRIAPKLTDALGVSFEEGINSKCLPVFRYKNNGEILAHRGIQKDQPTLKVQSYVAVLMLTQRGVDFEQGQFYLNLKAEASADGKRVTNDLKEDRIYPLLNVGDLILFDNSICVHGVEKTIVEKDRTGRFTCSWRSNYFQ